MGPTRERVSHGNFVDWSYLAFNFCESSLHHLQILCLCYTSTTNYYKIYAGTFSLSTLFAFQMNTRGNKTKKKREKGESFAEEEFCMLAILLYIKQEFPQLIIDIFALLFISHFNTLRHTAGVV